MTSQISIEANDEINIKKIILPNFILFKNKKKSSFTKKILQSPNEHQTEKCCKKKITFTNSWKNMQQSASFSISENNIQLFYLNNLNIFFHSTPNNNTLSSNIANIDLINNTQSNIANINLINNTPSNIANIDITNNTQSNIANNDLINNAQSNIANNDTTNNDTTNNDELPFEYGTILLNEIKKKLQGYKQQDIKKHIYDKNNFCNISTTIHLLTDTNLICYYCKENMKIIYDDVKDEKQWTLDRIDNNNGHNINNVLICCLKCNLKRRKQNMVRFHFAEKMKKQLIIERIE